MVDACFSLIGTACNVLFWLTFILCAYLFIFFKMQTIAFILLPLSGGAEDNAFIATMVTVFVGKFVVMVRRIWRQINVDIFLLDWEKPRDHTDDKLGASVSVWRKLFVANEWNELQSYRNISIELVLLAMLFFLSGINLLNLAAAQVRC